MNRKDLLAGVEGLRDTKGVVYKAEFPNGKIYIGITTQKLITRIREHERLSASYKSKFSNAIKKYGKNDIDWAILFISDDVEVLKNKEIEYVKAYDSMRNGYNISEGGQGSQGVVRDEIFKIKQKTQKNKFYKDLNNRLKISIAVKKAHEENPSQRLNHSTTMKKRFEKIELRLDAAKKQREFLSQPENLVKHSIQRGAIKFYVYMNANLVGEYLTQNQCARELDLQVSHINSCLKGKRKSHKGYTFSKKKY